MQHSAWVSILRQIPVEQYNNLMLVTSSGTEIAIQTILRIDDECLAIKGRLAGSQDAGRVFFIPYANIDYFGFQLSVKETEFNEMFPAAPEEVELPKGNPAASPAKNDPQPAVSPPASLPTPPGSGLVRVPRQIKSAVLERFRSRGSGAGTNLRPSSNE